MFSHRETLHTAHREAALAVCPALPIEGIAMIVGNGLVDAQVLPNVFPLAVDPVPFNCCLGYMEKTPSLRLLQLVQ